MTESVFRTSFRFVVIGANGTPSRRFSQGSCRPTRQTSARKAIGSRSRSRSIRATYLGWLRFVRRSHWDRDRAAELDSYVQIATDEHIARGLSPEEARHAARLKLGSTAQIREEIYHMNSIGVLDSLSRDLRDALRGMRRHPTFTFAVVLTLALGLGASTAIFRRGQRPCGCSSVLHWAHSY